MMRRAHLLLNLFVVVVAPGCFTINASLPGTLRGDVEPERTEKIGELDYELHHYFIPCGLGEAPEAELRKEILRQVKEKGADGVANLKLEAYNSAFDCLVGRACPIVQPRTFRISGDLIRIKKPPLPGSRPTEAPPAGPLTVENAVENEAQIDERGVLY